MHTEILLLVFFVWIMTIVTFYLGAKIGFGVSKKEELKLPNPIKAIEEHKKEQIAREEREVFEINKANIENYDGTGLGQIDFD